MKKKQQSIIYNCIPVFVIIAILLIWQIINTTELIPKYMLPSELVCLEKLPHTANDKIDRVTLKKTYVTGEIK